MILGIGIDVVENARIAEAIRRHGDNFVQKIYQLAEVEYCQSMKEILKYGGKPAASRLSSCTAGQKNWQSVWASVLFSSV